MLSVTQSRNVSGETIRSEAIDLSACSRKHQLTQVLEHFGADEDVERGVSEG